MQRFETKYDLLQRAYKDVELKKGAVALLQYLVAKSNKSNCFPAVDTIAAALGCCRRTVQYNMRRLEKAGYVIRKDRWYNHQQLSNQYTFSFDVVEDAGSAQLYEEDEYNKIQDLSFNNQVVPVTKAEWIKKIYCCGSLSKDEKHIMVYLIFRANRQGIAYDCISRLLYALGMSVHTLYKSLYSLRNMGMLKICKKKIRCQVVLVCALQHDCEVMCCHEDDKEQTGKGSLPVDQGREETCEQAIHKNNQIYHNMFLILKKISGLLCKIKGMKNLKHILRNWLRQILRI